MLIQLNDKEKVCNTQKLEIDSLKEEIAILSMCQNLKSKYEGSLEQNKKELSKLKVENHSLNNQLQKYQEECQGLIRQIENSLEEYLRRQLNMKGEICQRREHKILSLKGLVKANDELITKSKFGKDFMILDHILSHQISPHEKTGIGFDKSRKNSEEGESANHLKKN